MADQSFMSYFLSAVALLAMGYAVISYFQAPDSILLVGDSAYQTITTGTTGSGDVEIALTPSFTAGRLTVAAAFNTHSVDLSPFDLQQAVILELNGKEILPVQVFSLSGHHASGQIVFNIPPETKGWSITIRGIPLPMQRIYSWR